MRSKASKGATQLLLLLLSAGLLGYSIPCHAFSPAPASGASPLHPHSLLTFRNHVSSHLFCAAA